LKIGYMTQRFSLWEVLTVLEKLEFIGQIFGLAGDLRAARIAERLKQYHLEDRRAQRAGTMSGGQKQRLALAAATLHEPELLLLDEPTSAVDPQSRRDFWESLFELVDRGTTILVSTHYMDEAERCHGLAILDRGRLVAEGAPRKLMDSIDAAVIEIEADDVRGARHALDGQDFVKSVAQLGNRLHALLAQDKADPEGSIRQLLERHGVQGKVERVHASLEDVFVAATAFNSEDKAA
jgi:ABC-2 type transport system ATP-binding protein